MWLPRFLQKRAWLKQCTSSYVPAQKVEPNLNPRFTNYMPESPTLAFLRIIKLKPHPVCIIFYYK